MNVGATIEFVTAAGEKLSIPISGIRNCKFLADMREEFPEQTILSIDCFRVEIAVVRWVFTRGSVLQTPTISQWAEALTLAERYQIEGFIEAHRKEIALIDVEHLREHCQDAEYNKRILVYPQALSWPSGKIFDVVSEQKFVEMMIVCLRYRRYDEIFWADWRLLCRANPMRSKGFEPLWFEILHLPDCEDSATDVTNSWEFLSSVCMVCANIWHSLSIFQRALKKLFRFLPQTRDSPEYNRAQGRLVSGCITSNWLEGLRYLVETLGAPIGINDQFSQCSRVCLAILTRNLEMIEYVGEKSSHIFSKFDDINTRIFLKLIFSQSENPHSSGHIAIVRLLGKILKESYTAYVATLDKFTLVYLLKNFIRANVSLADIQEIFEIHKSLRSENAGVLPTEFFEITLKYAVRFDRDDVINWLFELNAAVAKQMASNLIIDLSRDTKPLRLKSKQIQFLFQCYLELKNFKPEPVFIRGLLINAYESKNFDSYIWLSEQFSLWGLRAAAPTEKSVP